MQNILTIYGTVRCARPLLMLVMDYAAMGSLFDVLSHASVLQDPLEALSWASRVSIAAGVAAGVEFLHAQSPPVIHCDLKCAAQLWLFI